MLNVWSVINGDKYTGKDVHILKWMCERNLNQPFKFRCLSDRKIDGIDCFIPEEKWPGWWAKLLLFRYAEGTCLYLDLDVVVLGQLDPLVSDHELHMPKNWAQSGHGGGQSSVMSWGYSYKSLPEKFNPEKLTPPEGSPIGHGRFEGLWGDQEYITRELGAPGYGGVGVMDGVYSYKYHCRGKPIPVDARVISFHGDPKPSEVNEKWVNDSRSTSIHA